MTFIFSPTIRITISGGGAAFLLLMIQHFGVI